MQPRSCCSQSWGDPQVLTSPGGPGRGWGLTLRGLHGSPSSTLCRATSGEHPGAHTAVCFPTTISVAAPHLQPLWASVYPWHVWPPLYTQGLGSAGEALALKIHKSLITWGLIFHLIDILVAPGEPTTIHPLQT